MSRLFLGGVLSMILFVVAGCGHTVSQQPVSQTEDLTEEHYEIVATGEQLLSEMSPQSDSGEFVVSNGESTVYYGNIPIVQQQSGDLVFFEGEVIVPLSSVGEDIVHREYLNASEWKYFQVMLTTASDRTISVRKITGDVDKCNNNYDLNHPYAIRLEHHIMGKIITTFYNEGHVEFDRQSTGGYYSISCFGKDNYRYELRLNLFDSKADLLKIIENIVI